MAPVEVSSAKLAGREGAANYALTLPDVVVMFSVVMAVPLVKVIEVEP